MNCHCTLSELQREIAIKKCHTLSELQREIPIYITLSPPPPYCLRATTGNPDLYTHTHARTQARAHTHTHTHTHALSQSYNGKPRFLYSYYLRAITGKPDFYTLPHLLSELPPGQDCTAEGQCVEHAECSTPEGGVCTCDAGFYKDVGRCLPLKPPGERCAGSQQCVNNAECSKTGQCQCSPGYYSQDDVCVVSTKIRVKKNLQQ